ncbi:FG-GAP repeat domain-containing protein [Actinoplanes missouriensis]|uniref:FG-GAP repeat domain-containing protein n=1 Tax=Actinoplanes missouriensis TaxID=1866 RepID=UPI003F4D1433
MTRSSMRTKLGFVASMALAMTAGTVVAGAQPAAAAGELGGTITRAEVLARAKYWYDRGDTWYSQDQSKAISDGDGHSYRPDCSGFVSMAWHLKKKSDGWDFNTGDFADTSLKTNIALKSLKPGDAILKSGHIELFAKWDTAGDPTAGVWNYAERDYGRKTEYSRLSWSYVTENFSGIRYKNIVDEVAKPDPTKGDFDGDGKADIALYRTGNGWWNVKSLTSSSQILASHPYGGDPSDVPVSGDFNGDGVAEIGVYRKGNGQWHVYDVKNKKQLLAQHSYGGDPSDIPVTGDFDGDGYDDFGVYRQGNGQWHIKSYAKGTQIIASHPYGGDPSDEPVVTDLDGDGFDEIGVYRKANGQWHIKSLRNGQQLLAQHSYGGDPSDIPVTGDFDGDGYGDFGVYRKGNGQWHIKSYAKGTQILASHAYGGDPSDLPVPADYDGDGATDIGIFRKGNGQWHVKSVKTGNQLIAGHQYGGGNDTPVLG